MGGCAPTAVAPHDVATSVANAALGKLPLVFFENRGQVDRRAGLYATGPDSSVYFTGEGLRLWLEDQRADDRRYAVGLDLVGARAGAVPVGRARMPATVSYFEGAASQWETAVPIYSKVAYEVEGRLRGPLARHRPRLLRRGTQPQVQLPG